MDAHRYEQQTAVVAVSSTAQEAELLQMTLVAHGIPAVTSAIDPAHPPIDFVQGVRVSVRSEDEEAARELLAELADPRPQD